MRYKCMKSYTSANGRKYSFGDVIYWSEYYNLPAGEDFYWNVDEEPNNFIV